MSLLDQEVKKQEPKGKKIVLGLLITSVILLVFAVVAMFALSGKREKRISVYINNTAVSVEDGLLLNEKDVNYISLQKISTLLGFNYNTGEYKKYSEDATNTNAYLEKESQVVQFTADSSIVYKTSPESVLDFEKYEIKNKVIKNDDLLYIALDDLPVALNVVYTYSEKDNRIILKNSETLFEEYKKKIEENPTQQVTSLSEEPENMKTIAYDMLVVANSNGKIGAVSTNYDVIIGNKYDSMIYIEEAEAFIVSDNNKYGVISKADPNQKPIIDLNYDNISVVSYDPLCYGVKAGDKILIANSEGQPVIGDRYDRIGCESSDSTEESCVVISNLGDDKVTALVVCKDGKYGLINLNDGSVIVNCILGKIYAKNLGGEKKYYIKYGNDQQQKEKSLDDYIKEINTINVNI